MQIWIKIKGFFLLFWSRKSTHKPRKMTQIAARNHLFGLEREWNSSENAKILGRELKNGPISK